MKDQDDRRIEIMPGLSTAPDRMLATAPDAAPDAAPAEAEAFLLPGSNYIGRGYNVVTGDYAYCRSAMNQLFEIEDLVRPGDPDHPRRAAEYAEFKLPFGRDIYGFADIEPLSGGGSIEHFWDGETITTVQDKINGQIEAKGKFAGFSGEVDLLHSFDSVKSATSYFCNMMGTYPRFILRLAPRNGYRALLKPEVREGLDTWTGSKLDDFFQRYGGYYIDAAVFGGSIKFCAARTTISRQTDSRFNVTMKAAYENATHSGEGKVSAEVQKMTAEFTSSSETKLLARGGRTTPRRGDAAAMRVWEQELFTNPDMIDFDNARGPGCRPVWALIEDPDRRRVVEEAFYAYARAHEKKREVYSDTSVRPLYGFFDNQPELKRWFYSMKGHARKGWKLQNKHIHVYPDHRIGCQEFSCIRKTVTRGKFLSKKEIRVHAISAGVPKGWEKFGPTFYAPTRPLVATSDTWTPIYEYTRKKNGEFCGKHYNTADAGGVKFWTRSARPVFYAQIR